MSDIDLITKAIKTVPIERLAQLYVARVAAQIINDRDSDQVPPLEVVGLATLLVTDAWKAINADFQKQNKIREHGER